MSTSSKTKIPVVNLRDYTHGTPEERERFVKVWGDALIKFGFVTVEGHPVDQALIRRVYDMYKELFKLPEDVKQQYAKVAGGARGYTPFGKEHAKDSKVADLKEFWHVGQELPAGHPYRAEYPDNIWPTEVEGFKEANVELFGQLQSLATTMMEALGAYFGEQYKQPFAESIKDGNHVLRTLHYPPLQPHHDPRAVRAAAHEDINMITILCEATSSGLELLTNEGEWLAIDALEGQMVVDAGDMLSRWTNGVIPSTTHRVVNPEGHNAERYSMPFFVHPYSAFNIECLPCCTDEANPPKFPAITAGEFLTQRLIEIGLLKK
jgi:isopenicillin N synthase-like dioxygenase